MQQGDATPPHPITAKSKAMEKERYIMFDWAMKRMLRDKANFAVLEGLLTRLVQLRRTILAFDRK